MRLTSTRLRDVAEVAAGGGAPQDPAAFTKEGTPFIRAGSLNPLVNGASESSLERLTDDVAKQHGLRKFPRDTVIFAKSGMSATKGHVYRLRDEAYVVNHLAAIIPNAKVLPEFLEHSLRVFSPMRLIQDPAYPSIRLSDVATMQIPLPPLAEQRRIAELLDLTEGLRGKRRATLAQLDSLNESLFFDLFGEPVTNPKGMRKAPLGELVKLKSGEFLPATAMAKGGLFPVFGGNGINGYHDKYMFEDPQIIVGRVGVYCGCVHVSPPKSWVTDNALYISERAKAVEFDYLVHALVRANLNRYASQSGQPLVSGSRIYPIEILVPPIALQREFACRGVALDRLKTAQRASLVELDALFASLQHRAFRGEL